MDDAVLQLPRAEERSILKHIDIVFKIACVNNYWFLPDGNRAEEAVMS